MAALPPLRTRLLGCQRIVTGHCREAPEVVIRDMYFTLAAVAGDPERPPFVQRSFPMDLRPGYDLDKLTAHRMMEVLLGSPPG